MSDGNILDLGKTPAQTVFKLSWPSIVEQVLVSLVSYVDTAMVGVLGASATAAVAVNTSTIWLVDGIMTAVSVGFMFLVARYIGEKRPDKSRQAIRNSIVISVLIGFILSLTVFLLSNKIPIWLGAKPDVVPHAQNYMKIVSLAFMFQTCGVVFSAILRGAGNPRLPLIINMGTNVINVILNFLLINKTRMVHAFGKDFLVWGAGLGVEGAAIATSISLITGGILLTIVLFTRFNPLKISFIGNYRLDKSLMRNFAAVSTPVAMERCCICIGQILLTTLIAGLGTASLAAHHICNTAESIFYLPAYGLSYSATTLVGQALGANRIDDAETFGKITIKIGVWFMVIGSACMIFFATPIISIFTPDLDVISKGASIFRIISFAEPFFGVFIIVSGILRGAGDAKYSFISSLLGMWFIRLGLAYVLAYPMGLGLHGAWIAVSCDLILRGILMYKRFKSGKWKYAWN